MATLQNLREDYLYEKLPDGIINLDEQSILRALIGGVQDRLEDIRSYAKKFEVLFSSDGVDNNVVLVTFDTAYGKTITRTLDLEEDTPSVEGTHLTAWAADQLGLDVSQITSCVFGEDLLRYVDTNTLQYLAATIGAVLYQTSAQTGSEILNQQKILNSYFPRLKIKGTAMSFDILGKLIGFDDVRMTPLWGRLSPRVPNDVGDAANDADFVQTPEYYPQQATGVAYDPHVFRDGPYYTWEGTVSADPTSTAFYTQSVNGFQPWVKVLVTGSVVHPAIGDTITLAGGSPHTKATADAGQGLKFQALGEGEDFNGLEVTFNDWNSGTDRLVSITDRLSTIKYRTSYFDLALTLTDEHAVQQFGTTIAKPNSDLKDNPYLVEGGPAQSPYRPWRGGRSDSHSTFNDFTWSTSGTATPTNRRTQASTESTITQFKTDEIQAAGQEAIQVMEEVRAATRFPRRSSIGFLNKDDAVYAAQLEKSQLFEMTGTSAAEGFSSYHPAPGYTADVRVRNATALKIVFPTEVGYRYWIRFTQDLFFGPYVRISDYFTGDGQNVTFYLVIGAGAGFTFIRKEYWNGTTWVAVTPPTGSYSITSISFPLKSETDPLSNGTLVRFSDGVFLSGTYDLDQHWYRFETFANHTSISGSGLTVDAYWATTDTETVRSDPSPLPLTQVFAAFGDNTDNSNTYMVGTLVASWQPEFLVMLGDHNYSNDTTKYPDENRPFLPWINDGKVVVVPGNHDYYPDGGQAFRNFFKSPERLYTRRIGNVEFFCIDDGVNSSNVWIYDDWRGYLSAPARWLKEKLSASQAPWKIVILHHNAYSSQNTSHNSYDSFKWPFQAWGADLVMNGHVHAYEHCVVVDLPKFNNGLHVLTIGFGGHSLAAYTVGSGSWGSVYRYPLTTQTRLPGATRFTVTATSLKWDTYTTDGVLRETYTLTKSASLLKYQSRPEDEAGIDNGGTNYETMDSVPWRRDLVGNGELVEVVSHATPLVDDINTQAVAMNVAVKDHTGVDYTVYGLNSKALPIRFAAELNPTDKDYQPGQLPIAYKGNFVPLEDVIIKRTDIIPGFFTDIETYGTDSFRLYHAGLVQGVFVADPVSFFGPHHRDGLKLWLPMNEHPEEGAVLIDRSVSGAEQTLTGFYLRGSFANRVWDESVGWNLYVKDATVYGEGIREVGADYSMSLWFNPDDANGTVQQTLFNQGPLAIYLNGTDNQAEITYVNKDGSRNQVGSFIVTPGTFAQVAVAIEGSYLHYGQADKETVLSLTTGTLPANYQPFNGTHTDFTIDCPDRGVSFHDLRVWNQTKTEAQLNKVRDYAPVPTICTYWPTNIEVAGSRDRYGMRVLDNGFITLDAMPPAVRMNRLARITRYNDEGRYQGEGRFNEVGLGAGPMLPPTWQLGQQFYEMACTGTAVVATTLGNVAGYNDLWRVAGDNLLIGLDYNGSTSDGIAATGTEWPASTWPVPMEHQNPCVEQIYLPDANGQVYEVKLRTNTVGTVELYGSLVQPANAHTLITNGSYALFAHYSGTVYQAFTTTGTTIEVPITTPALNYTSFAYWDVPAGYQVDLIGPGLFDLLPGNGYYVDMVGTPLVGRLESKETFQFDHTGSYRLSFWLGGNQRTSGPTFQLQATVGTEVLDVYQSAQYDPFTYYEMYFESPSTTLSKVNFEQIQYLSPYGNLLKNVKLDNITTGEVMLFDSFDYYTIDSSGGGVATPPVYMYLREQTFVYEDNAHDTWTDRTDANLFGNQQSPTVAALDENGIMDFENTVDLTPGRYRLTLRAGNVGTVDEDFEGYNVIITVGDIQIEQYILAGYSGRDFVGTEEIEFEVTETIYANWLLSIQTVNLLSDEDRGTYRRLAVYGYKIEKLVSNLYKVSANPAGGSAPSLTAVQTGTYTGTNPGGWLAILNSYGTVTRYVHESNIYPENDTVRSTVPLANTLTGSTWRRREDEYVSASSQSVTPDSAVVGMPSFISVIER